MTQRSGGGESDEEVHLSHDGHCFLCTREGAERERETKREWISLSPLSSLYIYIYLISF